jgi:hypothetical protein
MMHGNLTNIHIRLNYERLGKYDRTLDRGRARHALNFRKRVGLAALLAILTARGTRATGDKVIEGVAQ